MRPTTRTAEDGTVYRDLNRNGRLDPYEDPRLDPEQRTEDLLARLSIEEKVGLMFQPVINAGADGGLAETDPEGRPPTSEVVGTRLLNHFNVHALPEPRFTARWANTVQALAERTPHGIPVTISTDPRHGAVDNSLVSFRAKHFSAWPEPIGLAAIDDLDTIASFADAVRREYVAVGIRAALHPQVDLPTEPRWARQSGTFGVRPHRVGECLRAFLRGMQGEGGALGPGTVACTTKHFPGGGPQRDGEDPHFPYGREQVYPGGRFEEHLHPFRVAVQEGTAALMPYYGMPVGLVRDGRPVEPVGFGFNRQIVTGLLREELGYDGVVVTDWGLITDRIIDGRLSPARAWGVEHLDPADRMLRILDAGCDQFGGEDSTDLLLGLVAAGRVSEERIDASARRLLLVKFRLGLFDDPFVDEDAAMSAVGPQEATACGMAAQARSFVVLERADAPPDQERGPLLPLRPGTRVYLENVSAEVAGRYADPVTGPEQADLAVVRLRGPAEHREDLFLEQMFAQGSLDLPPGLPYRLRRLAARVPMVIVADLDRPAILTPLRGLGVLLLGGFGGGDAALFEVLSGAAEPTAALPVELPRSMDAVRASRTDVPNDTEDPLFPAGFGLGSITVGPPPQEAP